MTDQEKDVTNNFLWTRQFFYQMISVAIETIHLKATRVWNNWISQKQFIEVVWVEVEELCIAMSLLCNSVVGN